VTVYSTKAGRHYAVHKKGAKRWLRRRSSGGADQWVVDGRATYLRSLRGFESFRALSCILPGSG
jgi:hypothetical protein